MNKSVSTLGYILFFMTIALPIGTLASFFSGYCFELISYRTVSAVIALLALACAVLSLVMKDELRSKISSVLYILSAPLSLLNMLFYMFKCPSVIVGACMFIYFLCCCYLCVKHGKIKPLKLTAVIISASLAIPVFLLSLIFIVFGNIGQNTVTNSAVSPNGYYTAEVIDSDQGALGGDTLVKVYENTEVNAIIFKIFKRPQTVYFGNWGEAKNMQMYWKDNSHLVINSVEFLIE
ncbi:MAG: hypothetical protein IJD19_01665 [Ruminococcus sp.]|nr:hypothetical protein [Ruminococcus sp.]